MFQQRSDRIPLLSAAFQFNSIVKKYLEQLRIGGRIL